MIKSYLFHEDKDKLGTYILVNNYTGETYSGSGKLGECLARHVSGYNNGNHKNTNVREAFVHTPDGWEFIPLIIDEPGLSKEENRELAFDLEQSSIDEFHGKTPLFLNISSNARCNANGYVSTPELSAKKSIIQKEYYANADEKDREKRNTNISKGRKDFFSNGGVVHNKGKKIEDEEILRAMSDRTIMQHAKMSAEEKKITHEKISATLSEKYSIDDKIYNGQKAIMDAFNISVVTVWSRLNSDKWPTWIRL